MKIKGFSQNIISQSGKEYHLPRATYFGESTTHTKSQILELAKQAVSRTGKRAEILVVEHSSSVWSDLAPVK